MISFVIPAHDEEALIGATLDALNATIAALTLDAEVIVVDDASTDATAAIAQARGARVIPVQHRQIAATRNAGAQAAVGDTLFFVDADTIVDATAVAAALAALRDGAIGGGAAVRFDGTPPWPMRVFVRVVMQVFRWTRIAPGCFVFCQRDAFEAVGGFDQTWYAGEDVAISRALARHGRFVILREAVLTSDRKRFTHGALEQIGLALRLAWRGRALLKSREHLGLWYERRR